MRITAKNNLTALRIRKHMRACREMDEKTSASVAKNMQISAPYYSQIENGSRRLSMMHLIRWCDVNGYIMSNFIREALDDI